MPRCSGAFPSSTSSSPARPTSRFPSTLEARRLGRDAAPHASASAVDLDMLPFPDFDQYFEQLDAFRPLVNVTPQLLVETARGCWWGERSHCTFCGLNGSTMAFRSKSPERAVEEIAYLRDRHGVRTISVVDDILDMRYFKTLFPLLERADLDVELFWEVKANLIGGPRRRLRAAGVRSIQPGIESLSDHVLALMRKGTTGLKNIELLKWCREYDVTPLWNLLYGFPGETEADYDETRELIRAIWHLEPPVAYGPSPAGPLQPLPRRPGRVRLGERPPEGAVAATCTRSIVKR